MRVSTVTWHPGVRKSLKIIAKCALIRSGADVDKCRVDFDWWEVEWPRTPTTDEGRGT